MLTAVLHFHSQNQAVSLSSHTLYFSGFFEIYYVYDFRCGEPGQKRQSFLFNYNRHREITLNVGSVKTTWTHRKWSAEMGIHAGTYVKDNYSSENSLLSRFSELSITRNFRNSFSIRAGIMPSFIGFESVMPFEQLTLTRSLLAENSPYYFTGIMLGKKFKKIAEFSFYALTGWQRILPLQGRKMPAFGARLWLSYSNGVSFNLSTYFDPLNTDTVHNGRKFVNSYIIYNKKLFSVIAGYDIGFQPKSNSRNEINLWHGASFVFQYRFDKLWASSLRWEFYSDKSLVIISSPLPFFVRGISGNVDFQIQHLLFRIEIRHISGLYPVIACNRNFTNRNLSLGLSVSYKFFSDINR
jgi:hypothetical protein